MVGAARTRKPRASSEADPALLVTVLLSGGPRKSTDAYNAFDLQQGIRELSVLVTPTKRAVRDSDAEVRKHARIAYEAYERAKR